MSAPPLKTFGRTLQSGDPAPLDARRHRDMLVFLHPKKGSAAMASPVCSKCQQPSRRLEFVSNNAWVDYFRCETCGQVWACEKGTTTVIHIATAQKLPPNQPSE